MRQAGFGNRGFNLVSFVLFGLIWPMQANVWKTFTSSTYRYIVRYPESWYLDARGDILHIENFPPSKAVHAVHLPPDGAEITIFSPETLQLPETPKTLDSFILADNRRNAARTRRTFDLDSPRGKLSVVEVKARCCAAVPPFQEYVGWYFQMGGRLFGASILHWESDSNTDKLLQTLKEIVLTLKPTE